MIGWDIYYTAMHGNFHYIHFRNRKLVYFCLKEFNSGNCSCHFSLSFYWENLISNCTQYTLIIHIPITAIWYMYLESLNDITLIYAAAWIQIQRIQLVNSIYYNRSWVTLHFDTLGISISDIFHLFFFFGLFTTQIICVYWFSWVSEYNQSYNEEGYHATL